MDVDKYKDVIVENWFELAINMTLSRKRTRGIAAMCDTFNYMPMLKRVVVSKENKELLNLTMRFEAAVKEILAGGNDSSIAENYELDVETLREEIEGFRSSGAKLYEYKDPGKIFTVKEEVAFLETLATIPQMFCTCQTCTLKRLPVLAYHVARKKDKDPPEWRTKQEAGKEWLADFEYCYGYELLNSFVDKCQLRSSSSNT